MFSNCKTLKHSLNYCDGTADGVINLLVYSLKKMFVTTASLRHNDILCDPFLLEFFSSNEIRLSLKHPPILLCVTCQT